MVETKVGSPFGRDQLERYRKELNDSNAFEGVPINARYLVTLTTLRQEPSSLTNGSITWPEIHRIVSQYSDNQSALVPGVLNQFALFLKEKGLSMLELKKRILIFLISGPA